MHTSSVVCVGAGNVARDADGAAPKAGPLHRQVQGDPGKGKGTRLYVKLRIPLVMNWKWITSRWIPLVRTGDGILNDIVSMLRIRKKVSDPDPAGS